MSVFNDVSNPEKQEEDEASTSESENVTISTEQGVSTPSIYWVSSTPRKDVEIITCRVVCAKGNRGYEAYRERDTHHKNENEPLLQKFGAERHWVKKPGKIF